MQRNVKDAIGIATCYTFDFDYVYTLQEIAERIDISLIDYELDEAIDEAIDNVFIYYDNQWKVAKHFFNSPFDVSLEALLEELRQDIYKVIELLS